MIGELPKSLKINGNEYSIRTDYRDILRILCAFHDDELTDQEKASVLLMQVYKEFQKIPKEDIQDAYLAAMAFISCEPIDKIQEETRKKPQIVDWEKDEMYLFPAINKIAGYEVRAVEYMHWWTFLGLFHGISSDDTYGFILSIRQKRAKHKKLEKYEQEFFNANREICDLHIKTRKNAEDELMKIFLELSGTE